MKVCLTGNRVRLDALEVCALVNFIVFLPNRTPNIYQTAHPASHRTNFHFFCLHVYTGTQWHQTTGGAHQISTVITELDMSHIMRKPAFAICEQQICYSLLRQDNASSFYIQNFKPLASFYCCAGRFESYLVGNPEDRFSRDEAHIILEWSKFLPAPCSIKNMPYMVDCE